ncbi:uncharacterized protein LOC34619447 [Cyclospora cayetanensis]|uniref:Uncharacterized protein LOC34619447 n=1 Tax=Cyclospora cayetanensis TaxID=88456 RepID=A0A6P6RRT3_9EIME|nr:uncharacterized protein LOC34619447 [Cyclospora cayetanensis]
MQLLAKRADPPWHFVLEPVRLEKPPSRESRDNSPQGVHAETAFDAPAADDDGAKKPSSVSVGTLDFASPEGFIFLPPWVMEALGIQPQLPHCRCRGGRGDPGDQFPDALGAWGAFLGEKRGCRHRFLCHRQSFQASYASAPCRSFSIDCILEIFTEHRLLASKRTQTAREKPCTNRYQRRELRHFSSLTAGTRIPMKIAGTLFLFKVEKILDDGKEVPKACIQDTDVALQLLPPERPSEGKDGAGGSHAS